MQSSVFPLKVKGKSKSLEVFKLEQSQTGVKLSVPPPYETYCKILITPVWNKNKCLVLI